MNTEWNSYLVEVVQPHIQHDLRLEVGFRLSLYKLLLHKSGSFFKPHRDSEKDDGTFGTVVIQLPSFYDGGKLIVRHNHRTEEVDLSSAANPQNGFSIFYTAFYCDCEHEVLPITSGVRACLVYNLVTTGEIEQKTFPSATRLERDGREADLVDFLRNNFPNDQKMVYCLSHKYSQENLSLDNLKSTDRIIAQFFKKYADACSLDVMIGILKRKKYRYAEAVHKPRTITYRRREPNHMYWYNIENGYEFLNYNHDYDDDYDEIATISDVDSNDPNVTFYDDYKIKYLKSIDKECHHDNLPSMNVDFESEVLPDDCFRDVKAFYENQEVTENEGVQCSKFYRCAAIMIFRHDDLMPILVRGYAEPSKIEEVFLNEFKKHKDNLSDENVKEKCMKWSQVLMDRSQYLSRCFGENEMQRPSKIFENFLMLDNIELLQKFLQLQKFNQGDFSNVHKMCHKHGWATFSADIISKFGKLKPDERIVNLQKFIDYEDDESRSDADKQGIIHSIMKEMVTKFDHELEHPPRQPWHRYTPRPLKQEQRTVNTKKFLISLWPIAKRMNFLHLAEYTKSKPMNIIVPVLIAVAEKKENISNHIWIDVSNHFISEMEKCLERKIDPTFTWKQNVHLSCQCKDCRFVEDFLQRSFQQTLDFFGKKTGREHVQQILGGIENLTFWTTKSGVLRIKKTKKTGQIESEEQQFVLANLPKLRALITVT